MPEIEIYIAKDGHQYVLGSATTLGSKSARVVMSDDGTGMPPIDYVTERGPYQHGETVHDYWLRPRVIQMLIRQNFCSRDDYWQGRHLLLDALRPNRGLVGTLRKILNNGKKRDIDVIIQEGPRFEARRLDAWDDWSIQETLRFVAHNPLYYDPELKVVDFLQGACDEFTYTFPIVFCDTWLILPFTLPFQFSDWEARTAIVYDGTWIEFPSFELTGQMTGVVIENRTTGQKIEFKGFNLASGEKANITLSFGTKTAFKEDGTNLLPYLTVDSDFNDFHLAMGPNLLYARVTYSDAITHISMSYRERFIGI